MSWLNKERRLSWVKVPLIMGLLLSFFVVHLWADDKIDDREVMKRFIQIYFKSEVWTKTKWLGIDSLQAPTDNWVMQEIIYEIKPDFIIETGTYKGGTALFYATVLEKVNKNGKVITIDINPEVEEASKIELFKERVEVIKSDSVSPELINKIGKRVKDQKVLVILDSLHTKEHVLKELNLYSNFVSSNGYIVVADTSVDVYSLDPEIGPGPMEAVKEFLKTHKDFQIDHSKEKFLLTFYPSGFLKRIK